MAMKNQITQKIDYYYDFKNDLERAPDAWCYIIFGGRNTGKTYSVLRYATDHNIKFVYAKRTKEDVKLLCAGGSKKAKDLGVSADFSPFVSLNRDFGWNIRSYMLNDDIGVFCNADAENQPIKGKDPIGYIMALSCIAKYKGFDMSYCDWLIIDEFVPKIWERTSRAEGESILELYKTISRDREHRDRPALKMICLANADNASSPLTNVLEVTDDIVSMAAKKEAICYNEKRDIFLHRIIDNENFKEKEKQSRIYKSMAGTRWASMALENDFGYNDFSQVQKISLKHYRPLCKVKYKQTWYYIYLSDGGTYYFTNRRFNTASPEYDLNLDADVRMFFYEYIVDLQEAACDHRCIFETYTLNRLVYEYRNYFKFT